MYEELVKRLRRCSYSDPNGCEECRNCPNADNFYECKQKLLLQAANAIEELSRKYTEERNAAVELTGELASKPRWIPVTERLPEKYHQALCYGVNGISIDYYSGEASVLGRPLFMVSEARVTHWMPLPTPPKEDEA